VRVFANYRQLFAGLILAVVSWAVYAPAIHRVFVTDQIWYLAELDGQTSLKAGLHFYDYAASRRYWKGDDALFRPLSLTWLAVGNSLFSYHHAWWNVANIALHVLVAFSLYSLLMTVHASSIALPAAVLFTVMKPPLELVIWNHLGGYLLACLFLAVALRSFVEILRRPSEKRLRRCIVVYAVAFTAAAFCHEAMVPVCLIAGLLILWSEWRGQKRVTMKRAIVLFSPVLVFSFLYSFHIRRVERIFYVDRPDVSGMFDPRNVVAVIPRTLSVLRRWISEIMFPAALNFGVAPFTRFAKSFTFSGQSPAHVFDAFLCLMAVGLLTYSLSRKHVSQMIPFIALLCGACLAYIAVICLGRGQADVMSTTYYLYFFCFVSVVLAYAIVDFERLRGLVPAVWFVLVAMILVHATETSATTRAVGRVNEKPSAYLTAIGAFVASHKAESSFTFAVDGAPMDLDPEIPLIEGYPDNPRAAVRSPRLTEILFARYYNRQNPRYIINQEGLTSRLP